MTIKKFSLFIFFLFCFIRITQAQVIDTCKQKYWIFFKDKGPQRLEKKLKRTSASELGISERALYRRSKKNTSELVDYRDLSVYRGYVRILKELGLKPIVFSRWLNGVSVHTSPEMIQKVQSLSFVRKSRPVISFIRKPPKLERMVTPKSMQKTGEHTYDYGYSFDQNNQIRVPEVHDLGLNGGNVLIGMIDTGFDYQGKEAFSELDVKKEYDFHWNDSTTANQGNDPFGQDNHGTQTLSVIGGFWEENLIGPAFGASFMLAKTEWLPTETRIEEDHWVEAIEWMEREGVEVVSTSLGYSVFDGGIGYTYEDMDGSTCVTTRAADIAASKGVVVVVSAGNERNKPWYYITSPADGDSVIAVGAVNFTGEVTSFSSAGPTADGRIKPDVVAMGENVVTIYSLSGGGRGTSFSCPLVAGVCGLILQAHPELTPIQVREALRETADRFQDPDNLYGWGLVDAYEAVFYHGIVFTRFTSVDVSEEEYQGLDTEILWKYEINPDSVYLHYKQTDKSNFILVKMNLVQSGSNIYRAVIPAAVDLENIEFYVTARDSFGNGYVGPVGAPDFLYKGLDSIHSPQINIDRIFRLSQNYPNPFNGYTHFSLELAQSGYVNMQIYNIIGQKVKTVHNGFLSKGMYDNVFGWDGTNDIGVSVTSGIYILKTTVGKTPPQICKIIYVK
ncbi:MAG: S8 family serine peptidase [bacterium]